MFRLKAALDRLHVLRHVLLQTKVGGPLSVPLMAAEDEALINGSSILQVVSC